MRPTMAVDRLVPAFRRLLANPSTGESEVQSFLEGHSELIPTPFLSNHGLHFGAVISKLPLDTSLISDFAYLTKSSRRWDLVLVELEDPGKPIFTKDPRMAVFSASFNAALAQLGA